jgi:hypothetical protein
MVKVLRGRRLELPATGSLGAQSVLNRVQSEMFMFG